MSNKEEKKAEQEKVDVESAMREVQEALKSEVESMAVENKDQSSEELEDKIAEAMRKIVIDTVGDMSIEDVKVNQHPPKAKQAVPLQEKKLKEPTAKPVNVEKKEASKSARPKSVSMTTLQFDSIVPPSGEGEEEFPEFGEKKKHKGLKITGVLLGMALVVVGCVYAGFSYYYSDKFFQGTSINGIDCSNLTAIEVEQKIAAGVEDYSLVVKSRNQQPETILGSDINYHYVSNGDILNILKKQKPYEWIFGYIQGQSYAADENITFDKALLQSKMMELSCAKSENQVAPENAHIVYQDSQFSIVPETQGSTLITSAAYQVMEKAIASSQQEVDFEQEQVYETASVTQDDPQLLSTLEAYNTYTRASITYIIGDERLVLDGMTIKDWLTTDENGKLVKDDDEFNAHIESFVTDLANQYDTLYTDREFTATSGRTVTVYAYAYGWEINQDAEISQLRDEIAKGQVVEREPNYNMTANSHGSSDVGNTYIEVDLGLQHMYYYKNGVIVFESDLISGKPDGEHDTRAGIFRLYNKESPSVLRGEMQTDGTREYETQVSYWMAFDGGIGFHDAIWQYNGFGGSLYMMGYGSHGCVNLPLGAAAELYSIISYDDPIVCFY